MSVNFEMFFWVVDFLQKTNENKFTWGLIVVKLNSFVCFLEEIDDPKNHFENNWPLAQTLGLVGKWSYKFWTLD